MVLIEKNNELKNNLENEEEENYEIRFIIIIFFYFVREFIFIFS